MCFISVIAVRVSSSLRPMCAHLRQRLIDGIVLVYLWPIWYTVICKSEIIESWLSFMNGTLKWYESNCYVHKMWKWITCCVYTDGNAVVIKTEVDCSDITECSQDAQTSTGMFDAFDFIFSTFTCLLYIYNLTLGKSSSF